MVLTASSQVIDVTPVAQSSVAITDATVKPSFRELYDAHFDYVWMALRRLGVGESDREDMASEVFCRVHHRYSDYDPERPARPWLFAFAVRVASDYRRLARHRHEVAVDAEASDPAPLPDDELALREKRHLVMQGLASLDIDKRAVFIMHDLDGCSVPEISAALEIAEGTAYSRLRGARKSFAEFIRRLQLGVDRHE